VMVAKIWVLLKQTNKYIKLKSLIYVSKYLADFGVEYWILDI